MFSQFVFLLPLMAVIPCFALPAEIQITIHNEQAVAVSHQPHVSESPNLTVHDALQSINVFQKEATAIGRAAAAFSPVPGSDALPKDRQEWLNSLIDLHNLLKNQTANLNALTDRLYNSETVFSINDSVIVLKSVMTLMNGLNQTEFDPLVQFSATKLSRSPRQRRYFLRPLGRKLGGLVGWEKAMRETLLAYGIVFTHAHGEWPGTIEEDFEEAYDEAISAIEFTPYAVEAGGWSAPSSLLGNNAFAHNHVSL